MGSPVVANIFMESLEGRAAPLHSNEECGSDVLLLSGHMANIDMRVFVRSVCPLYVHNWFWLDTC